LLLPCLPSFLSASIFFFSSIMGGLLSVCVSLIHRHNTPTSHHHLHKFTHTTTIIYQTHSSPPPAQAHFYMSLFFLRSVCLCT
jgi:hypothetical protein